MRKSKDHEVTCIVNLIIDSDLHFMNMHTNACVFKAASGKSLVAVEADDWLSEQRSL